MLDSWVKYEKWVKSVRETDSFLLQIIPLHGNLHAAEDSPTLLFIKNFRTGSVECYSFGHPDIPQILSEKSIHLHLLNFLSNHKGNKWAINMKDFFHLFPVLNMYDVGVVQHWKENMVFELNEFDTVAHTLIRSQFGAFSNFNNFIPLIKHQESFEELAELAEKIVKDIQIDESFISFHRMIIDPLTEVEKYGLEVNPTLFQEHFKLNLNGKKRVFTQYNLYTSTGRPSNRFGGINYAALNKEDGSRKAFVSRWGSDGKLILIDYSAFHPRIISLLTNYSIPVSVDIYSYLAKLYFNKKEVDEEDIAEAKKITFRQFFGGVESKYQHIKYLAHLKDFIDFHWHFFNEHGYVETPIFKRKLTKKHIQSPKPATVFNYIMQAVEGEISIPILGEINKSLIGMKTKAVLYTYDSILFDYCNQDEPILSSIRTLMGVNGKFPTKVYVGDNYHDMIRVS